MATEQRLTEEQIEVLLWLEVLEKYMYENNLELTMEEIVIRLQKESGSISEDGDDNEILKVLEYYGYIDDEKNLTIDGKQYILLLKEAIKKQSEGEDIGKKHGMFAQINLEKVGKFIKDIAVSALSGLIREAIQGRI